MKQLSLYPLKDSAEGFVKMTSLQLGSCSFTSRGKHKMVTGPDFVPSKRPAEDRKRVLNVIMKSGRAVREYRVECGGQYSLKQCLPRSFVLAENLVRGGNGIAYVEVLNLGKGGGGPVRVRVITTELKVSRKEVTDPKDGLKDEAALEQERNEVFIFLLPYLSLPPKARPK